MSIETIALTEHEIRFLKDLEMYISHLFDLGRGVLLQFYRFKWQMENPSESNQFDLIVERLTNGGYLRETIIPYMGAQLRGINLTGKGLG